MSTASTYDVGDRFRVAATFTDTGGTTADPTAVHFHYKTPDGVVNSFTWPGTSSTSIIKASSGNYYYDITSTGSGYYAWRWSSTGSIYVTTEGKTYIRKRLVST